MQISMYNRVEAYLDFFKFPLKNYFEKVMVSKDFVRQKRAEYIRKWINRVYRIENIEIVSQTKDKITIKVLYYWEISSLHQRLNGESQLLMNIVQQNGKFKIISIQQL